MCSNEDFAKCITMVLKSGKLRDKYSSKAIHNSPLFSFSFQKKKNHYMQKKILVSKPKNKYLKD